MLAVIVVVTAVAIGIVVDVEKRFIGVRVGVVTTVMISFMPISNFVITLIDVAVDA